MVGAVVACRWAVTASAAGVLVGAVAPWVHSGTRSRTSFQSLDTLERLDLLPEGALGVAVRAWPAVPVVVVAAVALAWWGRWVAAGVVGLTAGVYATVVGVVVADQPRRGNVVVGGGPVVVAASAGLLVASCVALLLSCRRQRVAATAPAAARRRAAHAGDRS